MPEFGSVGHALHKIDAFAKVTGQTRYAADECPRGTLFAHLVHSPHAHAQVTRIDTGPAEAMPGVILVMTHESAPVTPYTNGKWDVTDPGAYPMDQRLFDPRVRCMGQPVAAVVAVDADTAVAAAEAIAVEYEPLPVLTDPAAALAPGAFRLHASRPDNVAGRVHFASGDVEAGLREADGVISGRFSTGRQKHAQMEPFACRAALDGRDRLTIWTPTQSPHYVKLKLAAMFGLPASRVRVITTAVGGGFGGRMGFVAEPYCAALALATRRPVLLALDRTADFLLAECRHPMQIELTVGYRRDGTLTAVKAATLVDAGPYLTHSMNVCNVHGRYMMRPYRCPNTEFTGTVVFTNNPVAGGFRGFGAPQAAFAMEQMIDRVAAAVGRDPLDLRRSLAYAPGDTHPELRQVIPSSGLDDCISRGAAAIGWRQKRGARRADGPWRRGVGAALVLWHSGVGCIAGPARERSGAAIRMNYDGTLQVLSGATDLGTGAHTTLRQVVAEALHQPPEAIALTVDDTDVTPFDSGSHASRTLFVCGNALLSAAAELERQVRAVAADLLEVHPEDLVLQPGGLAVRGVSQRSVTLAQVAHHAAGTGRELQATGFADQANAFSYALQFAEVAVNVETGIWRLERLVSAHDVGRAINPLIVAGQLEGGVVQGIGYARAEHLLIDAETGAVQNASFMDYKVLTAADVPGVEVITVEVPDPAGPFGAKGVGEPSLIGVAPAVANAVADAVGIRLTEMPLTPERLLQALAARGGQTG